ncbi:MAG: response regulator, partial [Proteobacteria bacterium]
MSFDPSLFSKWLVADDKNLSGINFSLVNKALFCAESASGICTGLTVFDIRTFNQDFVERLRSRKDRPEYVSFKFTLYLPTFSKGRAEAILAVANLSDVQVHYTPFLKVEQSEDRFYIRSRLRVVNVDDTPVLLKFLKNTLEKLGFVDVIAQISDSADAAQKVLSLSPDLLTMDLQMPGKNGVVVVREILDEKYIPTLLISSLSMKEGTLVFDALNAGAFDYLQKPQLAERARFQEELKERILVAIDGAAPTKPAPKKSRKKWPALTPCQGGGYDSNLIWCIGASTGGPPALTRILSSLPARIPPTLIVQHIPALFSKSFANSLNQLCPFTVKEVEDGEPLLPDHV